jgi:hypothetical protein
VIKGGLLTMIKKQQKWIALLVTLTFMWLLQVSTMPVAAANTPEQISSASNEQGPSFIEEEGYSGYQAPKKSILPIILIGVGVAAVAAVLFLVVLKTSYDITGQWSFSFIATNTTKNWTWTMTFTGNKKNGNFRDNFDDTGTYTVDGKNVHFQFDDFNVTGTGTFTSKDAMSGTATFVDVIIGTTPVTAATWTATRTAAAAAIAKPMTAEEKIVRK